MRHAVTLIALVIGANAWAQELPPSETKFYVQTKSGRPSLCGVEFWHPYRDHIYGQGAPTVATGSLAWISAKGRMALSLKVLGVEVTAPGQTRFFPIPKAFVTVGKRPYFVNAVTGCENPAGYCGLLGGDAALDVLQGIGDGSVSVSFNRTDGGTDLHVPIQVATTADFKLFSEFLDCVETLASEALGRQ